MKKSFRDAIEISSLELPGLGIVTVGLKVKHPVFGRGTVVSIVEWPPYVKLRHYSLGVESLKPSAENYSRQSMLSLNVMGNNPPLRWTAATDR